MEEFTDKVIIERSKLQDMEAELAMYRNSSKEKELIKLRQKIKEQEEQILRYEMQANYIAKQAERIVYQNKLTSDLLIAEREIYELKEKIKFYKRYRFRFWKRFK